MFSALFWSMLCLDCSGQDLRRIQEWRREVHLNSDFHAAFREPRRVVFLCDGDRLRCMVYYIKSSRTYMVKRVEFRLEKAPVGKVFMELQFLKQYIDYTIFKGIKMHVSTNDDLGVIFFQGPMYGYDVMVDAFYLEFAMVGEESYKVPKRLSIFSGQICSPRVSDSSQTEVLSSAKRTSPRYAWTSPKGSPTDPISMLSSESQCLYTKRRLSGSLCVTESTCIGCSDMELSASATPSPRTGERSIPRYSPDAMR